MKTRRHLLLTGASSGIGAACAVHLARAGWRVFAATRREQDGRLLREQAGENLEPVVLDVTSDDQIQALVRHLTDTVGAAGLHGLINNAGIVMSGPVEAVSIDDWRHQFEVNLFGVLNLTRACLPLLRRAQGRVVNMSSISGRLVTPFLGPYCASKFALEAVSDALRIELRPQGIRVALIEPGAVATPIWDKSLAAAREREAEYPPELRQQYERPLEQLHRLAKEAHRSAMPVEKVVKAMVHALDARRPRTRYLLGRDARLGALLFRLLPDRWADALIASRFR